jgi:hypothetical protein
LIWVPDEKQYPDVWENKREAIERYVKEEEAALEWLSKQPWTTLFVDGNHENFPRLYQFPVKDFHGGKAAQINDKIWHLKRGEVFEICGKKIFAMGGATSVDKDQRITSVLVAGGSTDSSRMAECLQQSRQVSMESRLCHHALCP